MPDKRLGVSETPEQNYKWKVLSTVIFGIFMIIMDTTVVNVAFQTLRDEFGGNLNDTQWIISVYVLCLGVSTPLAGFLANRFGSKKIYLGGLALFSFGSLLCGLSPNLGLLVLFRAIQGIGGGMAMPLGMALLLQAFPAEEQGSALGIFGIAALVAPAIGPILGGWLVDNHLWRVIFFINPPIGVLGVILGYHFLRSQRSEHKPDFDMWGVVSEVIGFGAILVAASIASFEGWGSTTTTLWFAVGVVGLVAFGFIELKHAKMPLLDLRLFSNRLFLNASLLGYISTVALFGAEFLMPIYLQALRGISALQTGLILLPMAITGGVCVVLSGRIYDRVGPRPLMVSGFSILMLNTWQLSQIRADTPMSWIIFLLALRGLALGLTVQTTMVAALSVVKKRDLPRGASLTNATRLVMQSIGVALLATVLSSTISPEIQALQNQYAMAQIHSDGPAVGLCQPAAISMANPQGLASNVPGGISSVGISSAGSSPTGSSSIADTSGQSAQLAADPPPAPQVGSLVVQACKENISGFEKAYRVTFFAASMAMLLGLLLPGWPGKWSGRQPAETSVLAH